MQKYSKVRTSFENQAEILVVYFVVHARALVLLTFLKLQNLVGSFVSPLVSSVYSGFCSVRGEYRFSSLVKQNKKAKN